MKPAASRSDSAELYLLATGFRGQRSTIHPILIGRFGRVRRGGRVRRASSAPASAGSRAKTKKAQPAITAMAMKAGWKSAAVIVGTSARPQREIDRKRADRDADRDRDLLGDRDQRGGAAHAAVVDVGIGDGVEAGEFERAEEAADDQNADDPRERHAGREGRAGRDQHRADQRIDHQHAAESVAPQDDRNHRLHAHGADDVRERDQARLEWRETEAELEQEREQERHRADAASDR